MITYIKLINGKVLECTLPTFYTQEINPVFSEYRSEVTNCIKHTTTFMGREINDSIVFLRQVGPLLNMLKDIKEKKYNSVIIDYNFNIFMCSKFSLSRDDIKYIVSSRADRKRHLKDLEKHGNHLDVKRIDNETLLSVLDDVKFNSLNEKLTFESKITCMHFSINNL